MAANDGILAQQRARKPNPSEPQSGLFGRGRDRRFAPTLSKMDEATPM